MLVISSGNNTNCSKDAVLARFQQTVNSTNDPTLQSAQLAILLTCLPTLFKDMDKAHLTQSVITLICNSEDKRCLMIKSQMTNICIIIYIHFK